MIENGCCLGSLKFVHYVLSSSSSIFAHIMRISIAGESEMCTDHVPDMIISNQTSYGRVSRSTMSQTKKLPPNIHLSDGFGTECVCFSSSSLFRFTPKRRRGRRRRRTTKLWHPTDLQKKEKGNPRTESPNELHKRLKKQNFFLVGQNKEQWEDAKPETCASSKRAWKISRVRSRRVVLVVFCCRKFFLSLKNCLDRRDRDPVKKLTCLRANARNAQFNDEIARKEEEEEDKRRTAKLDRTKATPHENAEPAGRSRRRSSASA